MINDFLNDFIAESPAGVGWGGRPVEKKDPNFSQIQKFPKSKNSEISSMISRRGWWGREAGGEKSNNFQN